jgi:hypothetical protein
VRIISQCVYCGIDLDDYNQSDDHVIPLCRGGSNLRTNMAPACQACNNAKGPLTAREFLMVRDDPEDLAALIRVMGAQVENRPQLKTKRRKALPPSRVEVLNQRAAKARRTVAEESAAQRERNEEIMRGTAAARFRADRERQERTWRLTQQIQLAESDTLATELLDGSTEGTVAKEFSTSDDRA